MSELDQLYQEFYAQVTVKIWADYEDFKKGKIHWQEEAQLVAFSKRLSKIAKNIIDTSDYVEVNKTDYEIKGNHNPFRFILIDLFRYHRSNTYKHNPVHNFFEEHFEEVITDAQQRYFDGINKNEKPEWENSFLIPPKEELVKILAAVDAYDNFNKEIHLQSVSNMSVKSTLNKWFAAGETERVVEALQSIAERYGDQYFQNDVTHQTGRFNGVKNQYKNGLISDDFYNREINKIRVALQDLIDKVPANATLENQPEQPESTAPTEDNLNTPAKTNAITPTTSPHIPWIVGLVLLIGATGLAVAVPCPSQNLILSSRILLALGAAGIATVLPGLFNINLQGIKAGSAVGVFALVYLVNPAKMMENNNCDPQFTSVTVFVHGKNGRQDMILRQQGFVLMDVGNERKRASINENGQAFFQNLRVGDTVQLNVDFSEPYKATHPDAKYIIENQGSIYMETTLQGLDKVFGTVLYNDNPLKDVIVSIGTLRDTTDETGYYEIRIPENLQQKQQAVKFTKPGFKMMTKTAYPQTNVPLNIIMEK